MSTQPFNSDGGFSTTGNITGNLFVGNGSQLTGLSTNSISNGTSNVLIATANGNPAVTSAGNTWTFGGAQPDALYWPDGSFQATAFVGQALDLVNTGPASITSNSTGNTTYVWTFGDDGRLTFPGTPRIDTDANNFEVQAAEAISLEANTVVNIYTDSGNNAYQWQFGDDGTLTLPNGAVVKDNLGDAVAFGQGAGETSQGTEAVSIGLQAGFASQGNYAVAIGKFSANSSQGNYAVAVGPNAGFENQLANAVAVGSSAGSNAQGTNSVAVGVGAAYNTQGNSAVAVGNSAGYLLQGLNSVAVGDNAGFAFQGANSVAVGRLAGNTSQGNVAVAVGFGAGLTSQGVYAIAIGGSAAATSQGDYAVSMGYLAGTTTQGTQAVAIGLQTGGTSQGAGAVALGTYSGRTGQGTFAVAIGYQAGNNLQANNSIILNATGAVLDQTTANTFTVAPVRNDVANIGEVLFYNATSKEITYGNVISVAGNITGGNLLFGSGVVSGTGNILGGNLAISGNSATITSANYSIGYLNIPQVSFAANATIGLTDAGKHYYSTSASNLLLTIANNTSVSWTVGTAITIVNRGTANITIAQGTGVSLYLAGNSTSGNRTMTTYGMATLMNVAANVWMINGTGVV